MSLGLVNSHGLELSTTETQKNPPPQPAFENNSSAPRVVNGDMLFGESHGKFEGLSREPPKEKILGLSKKVFGITLVLVLLLVLGIGLGSGLAVGLRHGNKSSATRERERLLSPSSTATIPSAAGQTTSPPFSTTTTTPSVSSSSISATISAPVTSGTTGLAANSCNFMLPRTHYTPSGTGFTQYCFTDWPNKSPAADGRGNITDLSYTTVYTFEDCMQECLDYNERLAEGRPRCTAITYNSNLTSIVAVGRQGGNCFLKDKRGMNLQGSAESACAALVF